MIVGARFGRLEVVRTTPRPPDKPYHIEVRCECGVVKLVRGYDMRDGFINSCGCIRNERLREMAANRRNGKVSSNVAF